VPDNELLTKAWSKITGNEGKVGRAAYIPVFDQTYESWRLFRNLETIYEGAENCSDPVKVEQLRRNTANLISHYPNTVPALEKLGIRVKQLLNRPIKTQADVTAWADSVFNVGPVTPGVPDHIAQAQALAYDDFHIEISRGRGATPAYVVPTAPRGSGISSTLDFTRPGLKATFGPRNEISKAAFADQNGVVPKAATAPPEAPKAAESTDAPMGAQKGSTEAYKPRGRPRADGLTPGSDEAKAADVDKRRKRRQERRSAASGTVAPVEASTKVPEATITQLPVPAPEAPRRRLITRRSS
jgi:hypothetical protein